MKTRIAYLKQSIIAGIMGLAVTFSVQADPTTASSPGNSDATRNPSASSIAAATKIDHGPAKEIDQKDTDTPSQSYKNNEVQPSANEPKPTEETGRQYFNYGSQGHGGLPRSNTPYFDD